MGGHEESAIANGPAAGRLNEPHCAEGAERSSGEGRVSNLLAVQRGELPGGAGYGAEIEVEEVAGEPVSGGIGRERLPSGAAIARSEHARGGTRRGFAESHAAIGVEKLHAGEAWEEDVRRFSPGGAAIGSAKHDAPAGGLERSAFATDGPAALGIEEVNRREITGGVRGLRLPSGAAIGRVQDDAAVAHGPALCCIDEADAGERGIVAHNAGRGWRVELGVGRLASRQWEFASPHRPR